MPTGRCYCGAVRYELRGELGPSAHCHCRSCRRAHGAAFATASVVSTPDLHITAGGEHLREYPTSRGARFFCGRCAGRLFNRPRSRPEMTMLLLASLDEEPEVGASMHLHVGSKAPWFEILDDLPQHLTRPPAPGREGSEPGGGSR